MSRSGLALALAVSVVVSACGAPKAQEVGATGGDIRVVVPADWVELGRADIPGGGESVQYGLPGVNTATFGPLPMLTVSQTRGLDSLSFRDLRSFITAGESDPLAEDAEVPEGVDIVGYTEIAEPDVWGVRMVLLIEEGSGALDYLSLVNRHDQTLTVSEVACTQACFVARVDEINEIQESWTLGSQS